MKTISIPGFIYAEKPHPHATGEDVVDGVKYGFWIYDDMDHDGHFTKVCTHTLTFQLPEKFNAQENFIKQLQAEKKKAMADFQARCTEIDRQISQLQAIEYTPGVAA